MDCQPLVGSLLWNSFQAKQAMEGLWRLFQANLDQHLGRPLDLTESQATERERWLEFARPNQLIRNIGEREVHQKRGIGGNHLLRET